MSNAVVQSVRTVYGFVKLTALGGVNGIPILWSLPSSSPPLSSFQMGIAETEQMAQMAQVAELGT